MRDKVFKEVADSLGFDEGVVKDVFMITWEFIKSKTEELPLKSEMTEDEFNKLKASFSLPKLGKFGCDYQSYLKNRKRFFILGEYGKSKNNECEASSE